MRDLKDYFEKCKAMLDELNIPYGNIVDITVNTRAKNRWGQCRRIGNVYTININHLLLKESTDERGLINTIVHEILHSCPDCMNHGKIWKHYAKMVNDRYHLDISRCSSADKVGLSDEDKVERVNEHRYVLKCEKCGQIITRQRKSDFVKNYNDYRCGRCRGNFIRLK